MSRWGRVIGAVLLAGFSSVATAQISVDFRPAAPGSDDLVLRWAADASLTGPFDLLRKSIPANQHVADHWPLDPVANLYLPGFLNGATLSRSAEAFGAPGTRVYQIVDATGGCSNAFYLVKHGPNSPPADWVRPIGFSFPWRSGLRSVGELFAEYPTLRAVFVAGPALPLGGRAHWIHRMPDGDLRGGDWYLPPGSAIGARWEDPPDITIVGAAEPSPRPLPAGGFLTGEKNLSLLSPQLGQPTGSFAEVLCGRAGIAWPDPDGDREPDTDCPGPVAPELPGGLAGGAYATCHQDLRGEWIGRTLLFLPSPTPLRWLGPGTGDVETELALFVNINKNPIDPDLPVREWLPDDLAAPAACRCPDSDGDGDDDCTEELFGTDPGDPDSRGPDHDGDGVPDDLDVCPLASDPLQANADGDAFGDACDPCPFGDPACDDPDGDGTPVPFDNCPTTPNLSTLDNDDDGVGDDCDNCPGLIWTSEADADGDGHGDACDLCPIVSDPLQGDRDADGFGDACDFCPELASAVNVDSDGDGFGEDCDCAPADAGSSGVPQPRADLRVSHVRFSAEFDPAGLVWDETRDELGAATRWAVSRGEIDSLWLDGPAASASCLEPASLVPNLLDAEMGSYWYLVRARNACGAASWGIDGRPSELDGADPCP